MLIKCNKEIKNTIAITKKIPWWSQYVAKWGQWMHWETYNCILKDCTMAIFFWVKTMMNADKIVKLGQSIWWTTYDAAAGKCWVTPYH